MFSWASPWTVMLCMSHPYYDFTRNLKLTVPRHVLIDFREDGTTPYATVWADGLKEMKV